MTAYILWLEHLLILFWIYDTDIQRSNINYINSLAKLSVRNDTQFHILKISRQVKFSQR